MKLLGIAGTNGSGKDSLSEFLGDEFNWLFVSVSSDLIIPELKRRGLPLERKQMAALSAEWNREISKGAVIDKAIERFNERSRSASYNGLVVSSIRHPWEADRIHELGGHLVWIDADPAIRYSRIFKRGQGDKDQKTFEQFLVEEQAEMKHSGDEATLNMAGVKAKADIFLTNNTSNLEGFKLTVQETLGL